MEEFKTIKIFNEYSVKEKNSIFNAKAFPVDTEEKANKILTEIRKKYYDASHHCFAFKLINQKFKYSDDGEPNGTAGIRILNAIDHFNLLNILVIVTRYFGGKKLGAGLLGKTYYSSAFEVLQNSKIITKKAHKKISVISDFNNINIVHKTAEKFNGKVINSRFTTKAFFYCLVRIKEAEQFKKYLEEISNGKIEIKIENEIIYQ